MTPQRWQLIDRIFKSAIERTPADRAAFLIKTCDDDELRAEVESLISAHEQTGEFLDTPAYEGADLELADHPPILAVGQTINHYQVLGTLGVGGMGEVYLAHDTRLGRKLALKLLPADFAKDEKRVRRFVQEAQAASALNHPNVCVIHEINETDDGRHFIAMEYIEGTTLRQRLAGKRLKIVEALELATQVAAALAAAHSAGIVNRDVKPENVMIRSDGLVKVLDFGLAKRTASPIGVDAQGTDRLANTAPGMLMGTVSYMSPEQVRGLEVDARTDIWSVGVVLYEMVTGEAPFQGASTSDVIVSVLEREPIPVTRDLPEVPLELQRIITKALRKDREERYQKVEAMLLDLKSLKHELELKARPENSTQSALNSGETHVAQQDTETKGSLSFGSQQVSASTATAHEERSRAGWWSTHPLWLTAVLAVVLVSATSFYFVRHSHEAPLPPMKVTPFTSFEGQEFSPAFSPDGNQIAFAWGKSEKGGEITFDIYVKQIGSEKALQITSDPAWDMGPVWSPDGQKIAFARYSESDVAIFTVSSLGGAERKLLSLGPRTTWVQLGSLSWSANGKFIAYSSKATAGQPLQIFLLAPDSLEKHTLTSPPDQSVGDDVPAFSPDSQTLAFTRTNNDATSADIYVLPVTGGEPRRLTFDNVNPRGLDWTADGREIVFSSNREGPREGPNSLWKISASGGLPERLAVGGDNVVYPSISRRGHRLAYAKGSTGDVNIYRIERSGSSNRWSPPTKFISSTQRDTNAQFSPDGKHIVFESSRAGNFGIWVCDNDGSNPVEVSSSDREWTGTPRWSPDGRQIAFDLKREHDWDIYTTGVDGGPPRRLTTESSDENVPSWSRDGRWIYFSSNRTGKRQVWKAPAEGGEAVQVTKEGGFLAFESPDGKFVYYTEDYEGQLTPGIWRIPTGGGEETRVLDSFNPVTWGDWAIVSDGIYFIDSDAKGYWAIRFFDFAKRSVTKIAPLDHEIFNNGLAVSPDRRQILYTRVDEIGGVDIWLVENFR